MNYTMKASKKLDRTYRIGEKGIDVVHEEVQQRLIAVGAKLVRYDNRTNAV